MSLKQERIEAVAIHRPNGVTYLMPLEAGHTKLMSYMVGDSGSLENGCRAGYMTNTERFVGRMEAAFIAFAAGQIRPEYGRPEVLYDTHLYFPEESTENGSEGSV